ncbi:MAG: hypothetical protein KJT01_01135 [Gemmatimonadetes bacterium]|nr:hypothetical protein [Gemmatimonadota bacterium]
MPSVDYSPETLLRNPFGGDDDWSEFPAALHDQLQAWANAAGNPTALDLWNAVKVAPMVAGSARIEAHGQASKSLVRFKTTK